MNSFYFPKVNLNTASLLPGFVNFTTYFVDISTDESSYTNLRLGRSISIATGTHLAVTVISNSCTEFIIYFIVDRKSPSVSLANTT